MVENTNGRGNPVVRRLVFEFMRRMARGLDDGDRAETDGWTGRILLFDTDRNGRVEGGINYDYAVTNGEIQEVPAGSNLEMNGTVRMSQTTFFDLVEAGTNGTVAGVWLKKYQDGHIYYTGDRWLIDSERFRKVLMNLQAAKI